MDTWALIAVAYAVMVVLMALMWWWQRVTGNAGIVDVAWSFGTGLCGMWFAWGAAGAPARRGLLGALVGVWALRLGLHLLHRMRQEREDGRYAALRAKWGARTQAYLFAFFQVQAAWAVLFALPMLCAAANPVPALAWHDWLALGIWVIAVAGEAVADRQLARFRHHPAHRGLVCQTGLWRYSRHPNYFFEWLHWWSYVALSIGSVWVWPALGGPLVMYLFLTRVTGIPPTEAQALRSRGDAYRQYQRTTNALFPGPRRRPPVEPHLETTA